MNISHWIENWALANPEKIALHFEGEDISYRDFDARIKANARALTNELGVEAGDRVAYLGQNHPQSLVLFFACARLGAIFVPLNWRLAPPEHRHILKDSGARALIVDEPYREQCEPLSAELENCTFIALHGDAGGGWLLLPDLIENGKGDVPPPHAGGESPLLLIYTSGTTGFPKGAVLTHDSVQYNAYNSIVMHDMTSHDVVLTVLPLFHVGGLNNQTTPAFYAGATVILHRVFNPARMLDDLLRKKPTLTIILPAHMQPLRELPGWDASDFSSLRSVLTGSTSIPDEMIRYWHGKGIPLVQVYGSSETCPIAIHQTADNALLTEGTIGFPAMHCEIRIVNEQGVDCWADQPGEIYVRGNNVMSHYWHNEKATRESLTGGWFHTGDIGYFDHRGCYHFLDRKKDVIISGSENIYPAEIENVLTGHPDILEVAVVGRKDPRWGEAVVAVIVKKGNSQLEEAQVREWLDGKLGRYKHPRSVLFVDALPRNEMRKVQKHVLRDLVNQTRL
jgi:fatty-acyl-CoA synthase